MRIIHLIFALIAFLVDDSSAAWNADAGLILGHQVGATVRASNGGSDAKNAIDGNEDTLWDGPWCASCCSSLTIDLLSVKNVGWFYVRTSGDWVDNVNISSSVDNTTWTSLFAHPKGNWRGIVYALGYNTPARYVKAGGCSNSSGGKIQIKEIRIFDKDGRWGPPTTNMYNPNTFGEILGVNGIWQWGGSPNSPTVYSAWISYARNYENMNWNIDNPNQVLQYNYSTWTINTNAGSTWLNWDTEYGIWKNGQNGIKGFTEIDVSISFSNDGAFSVANWNNPYQSGYTYGYAYARQFGPTYGNKLVKYVEYGNEPWSFPADFYRNAFKGFTDGVKAADPSFLVLPCALQADTPEVNDSYTRTEGNYIGARVNESMASKIDIINTHAYSYYDGPDWLLATYPEDLRSTMNAVRNVLRWRDSNMPGKKVFLTEWGWDGATVNGGTPCFEGPYHKVCVSSDAKALYAMRGLLKIAREGLDRGTWFFYADIDDGSNSPLYARSGLVSSKPYNFKPEPVFNALQRFLNIFRGSHFVGIAAESTTGYAYLLGSSANTPTHLVAWLPIDANSTSTAILKITPSGWTISSGAQIIKLTGTTNNTVSMSSVITVSGTNYSIQVDTNLLVIPVTLVSTGTSTSGSPSTSGNPTTSAQLTSTSSNPSSSSSGSSSTSSDSSTSSTSSSSSSTSSSTSVSSPISSDITSSNTQAPSSSSYSLTGSVFVITIVFVLNFLSLW